MKFIINTAMMKNALSRVCCFVEAKADVDAFRRININLRNQDIILSVFTVGTFSSEMIPVGEHMRYTDEGGMPCSVSLPAKKIMDIISSFSLKKDTTISLTEKTVTLSQGRSRFSIQRDSYPMPERCPSAPTQYHPFSPEDFSTLIKKASCYRKGKNIGREWAEVIHINKDHFVYTDGSILSVVKDHPYNLGDAEEFNLSVYIAEKLLKVLKQDYGEYSFHEGNLHIRAGNFYFRCTGVNTGYPGYRSIMRKDHLVEVGMDFSELNNNINRVAIAIDDIGDCRPVTFEFFSGELRLSASGNKFGESESFLEDASIISVTRKKPLIFDASLLSGGLSKFSGEGHTAFIPTEDRPALFTDGDYEFYINPLRF